MCKESTCVKWWNERDPQNISRTKQEALTEQLSDALKAKESLIREIKELRYDNKRLNDHQQNPSFLNQLGKKNTEIAHLQALNDKLARTIAQLQDKLAEKYVPIDMHVLVRTYRSTIMALEARILACGKCCVKGK